MRCAALVLSLLLFSASAALAEDRGGQPRELPEMVVTATAEPSASTQTPVHVQVIDRKAIDELGASTLDDLVALKVPASVTKYPGAYSSAKLRGFDTYASPGANMDAKTLVLVDGNPVATGNLALIPLGNVERVEVMRGPGSVLYGASAMGGVINVITRRGKGKPSGAAEVRYGSFNRVEPRADIQGGLENGSLGASLAGRVTSVDAYDASGGWRYPNTAYHDGAASGTVTIRPVEGHALHLMANFFNAYDVGDPGPVYSRTPSAKVDDVLKNFAATYTGGSSAVDVDWRLAFWANRHEYDNTDTPYYDSSKFNTDQIGLDGRVTVPTFSFGRFTLGARYQNTEEKRDGDGVYAPDSRYANWAAYGEEKLTLGDITLLGGLRYDNYQLRINGNTVLCDVVSRDKTMDHLSWRFGANWNATDWLTLRATSGSAFTPPDAYKFSGRFQQWGTWYLGNSGLKPETSVTGEAGADVTWNGLEFSGTYFNTAYNDAITTATLPATASQTWVNSSGWRLSGLEGFVRYTHTFDAGTNRFSLTPSLNWIWFFERAELDDTLVNARGTDTVLGLSRYTLTPGLQIGWNETLRLDLSAQWQGDQKVQDFNPYSPAYGNVVDKDPFFVFNAKLSYRPVEKLEASISVNNIADERYSYVRGYPMPGRTFSVGLRYAF